MEYLHGHHHDDVAADLSIHTHEHTADHAHLHDTESAHGHHHHEHRGLQEITDIIEHSVMTDNAKKIALSNICKLLAEAESKAHNLPVDQIHFL